MVYQQLQRTVDIPLWLSTDSNYTRIYQILLVSFVLGIFWFPAISSFASNKTPLEDSNEKAILAEIIRLKRILDGCNHYPISYSCSLAPGDFNLRCIPIAQRCDGHYDCPFGDDEDQCDGVQQGCSDGDVCCLDGQCASVCNGFPQCANGADESNCPVGNQTERCPSGMIQCPSGACATMCDGVVECNHYSDCEDDEAHCRTQCPAEQVVCNTPGLCGVPCSNEDDCPDKIDEQNCYLECGIDEIGCETRDGEPICGELCSAAADCDSDVDYLQQYCGDTCGGSTCVRTRE